MQRRYQWHKLQAIHFCMEETQTDGLHSNYTCIGLYQINQGTTTISHEACFLMTIELASKYNEIWDTGVILAKFFPWFEPLEGVVVIDAFEFQSDGVLPKCVTIGLVKFQSVFHILWDFDTKHELDSIDACLVSMYH